MLYLEACEWYQDGSGRLTVSPGSFRRRDGAGGICTLKLYILVVLYL